MPITASPQQIERLEQEYRAWAITNGLVRDEEIRGYTGVFRDRNVTVRPGLEGSAPVGVEVEILIEHEDVPIELLKPTNDSGQSDLATSLRVLFTDDAIGAPPLLSIAVLNPGVRLRFAAMTDSRTIERAIERTIDFFEVRARNAKAASPYR